MASLASATAVEALSPDNDASEAGKSAAHLSPTVERHTANSWELTLASPPNEFDLRTLRRLEDGGFMKRPRKPDDLFSRIATGIFDPEPVRIGKTTVCCSVITAIKRKNPLCLLNPIVLAVSW
jgi:hypothetical protein